MVHYGSFVQSRVAKIRSLVGHESWYFIDSSSNPVDILSRGALLSNLKDNNLWYSELKQVLYSDTPLTRFSILCKDDSFDLLLIMDNQKRKTGKFEQYY